MSSARRSMHYARALLRAFQKEPCRHSGRPSAIQPIQESNLNLLISVPKHRWTAAACPLPHAGPSSESFSTFHAAKFSSAASPEISGKPGAPGAATDETTVISSEEKAEPIQPPITSNDKGGTGVEQGSKTHEDLLKEVEDLMGLLGEREALVEEKDRALAEMKDQLLRSYAEMENRMERSRRETESTRKYSIQGFASSLLDVADNLARAAEGVRKAETSEDASANAKLLQSFLEGVEMTEKQLLQAFEKHGLQRFDPLGQTFDPNEHQAVFEVEDESKVPGTVAVVMKVGFKLHERVIRPAVVGVVKEKAE